MQQQHSPNDRDPHLWEIAKRRASFKSHLITYVLVNIMLWLIWAFTMDKSDHGKLPWPVWTTLGWGIGLASHYASAYLFHRHSQVDKEYEKLKNQQTK